MIFSNIVAPSSKFFKTALMMGVPYGVTMSFFFLVYSGLCMTIFGLGYRFLAFGVAAGLISGILFGVLMAAVSYYQGRKLASENPCVPGEELFKHGMANHGRRGEGVGGYLYLTDRRLLFKSHRFNIQNHDLSIPLEDISSVRPSLTMGLIPNGLQIFVVGRKEHFVVSQRHDWIEQIERVKQQRSAGES